MDFLILYFANLLLDYPLQGEFLATYKSKSNYVLFVHSAIWGIGLCIVLMYLNMFAWWKLVFLVIGHMIIDAWKCRYWFRKGVFARLNLTDYQSLFADQTLHVAQLIIVFLL